MSAIAGILANLILSESAKSKDDREFEQYKKKTNYSKDIELDQNEKLTRQRDEIARDISTKTIENLRQNGALNPEFQHFPNETIYNLTGGATTAQGQETQGKAFVDMMRRASASQSDLEALQRQSGIDRQLSFRGQQGPDMQGFSEAQAARNSLEQGRQYEQQGLARRGASSEGAGFDFNVMNLAQRARQLPTEQQLFDSNANNTLQKNQLQGINMDVALGNEPLLRTTALNQLRGNALESAYANPNMLQQPYVAPFGPEGASLQKNPLYKSPYALGMEQIGEMNGKKDGMDNVFSSIFGAPAKSPEMLSYTGVTAPRPPNESTPVKQPNPYQFGVNQSQQYDPILSDMRQALMGARDAASNPVDTNNYVYKLSTDAQAARDAAEQAKAKAVMDDVIRQTEWTKRYGKTNYNFGMPNMWGR